jgi:hypothetical protein
VTTAVILPAPVGGKVVGPATVVLTATDDGTGIASTEYALDGGSFQTYTGPVTVDALGDHTVGYRSTDRDGAVETAKQIAFTVVAPPTPETPETPTTPTTPTAPEPPAAPAPPAPTAVCARPQLEVRVLNPLARHDEVAILRKGKAYRYAGRLTCGGQPAPAGTAIAISTVVKGRSAQGSGVTVAKAGKFVTLLRFGSKRTVVFTFADAAGSAQAKVSIDTGRR